ncbi:hypothetical protein ABH909_004701 [Pseudomonas sp. BS3782 TE3695]
MVSFLQRVTLEKPQSNQRASAPPFGASPRLGMPSLRHCSGGPPPSAIHGRRRLPRHPCRGAPYATPAFGLWERDGRSRSRSKAKATQNQKLREQARSHRGDVHLQETGRLSGRLRSDAGTRQASSHKKSERIRCAFHHSTGRALARLQLLMLTHRPLERPRGGSAQWATRHGCRVSRARPWMADRGGPTEQDRSEGMPSLGEAPNERGKSVLVTLALFQSDPL